MSVIDFPEPEAPPPLLIGPFEEWRVIVDGRAIPNLTGRKHDSGHVSLTVDNSFTAVFENEAVAAQAAWLIAQGMAISAGYSHLGAPNKDMPFAPQCFEIESHE